MSPRKINNTPTPLASEYVDQKKLVLQEKKAAVKQHKTESTEDVVTISSQQPDAQNRTAQLPPSQPVTFEEKQALKSTFSVLA